jgi:hypothetical protein
MPREEVIRMGDGANVLAAAGKAFGFAMCLLLVVFCAGVFCLFAASALRRGCARARDGCRRRMARAAVHAEAARGLAEIEKFLKSQPSGSACGEPPDAGGDGISQ